MRSLVVKLMATLSCIAALMVSAERMFDATSNAALSMEGAVKSIKNLFGEIFRVEHINDDGHKDAFVGDNSAKPDDLRLNRQSNGGGLRPEILGGDKIYLSQVRSKTIVRENPGDFSKRVYIYEVGSYLKAGLECNKEKWCFVSDPEKGITGYTESENLTIGISK